ncbi:peptidase A2 domain-containing protein [Trichonephila clavata]|uniref:Peptidase A2 domain-containing protein n=1 Tax=Trichonephila clavata TaxID=2740835 RepID=A0A8X6H209_TRICU|nr:peptidase A2 domain-containing protein [Trichonephila clavata]
MQKILAISNNQLDKLAEMADGIMAVAGPTSSIHMIDAKNQDPKPMLMEISSRLSHLETRATVINRLYLSDRISRSKYPIDTEADVSVIPLTMASKHLPRASLQLFAANGTVISSYGQ